MCQGRFLVVEENCPASPKFTRPGETPVEEDGRSWLVTTVDALCDSGFAEHFHAAPSPAYPLGDALEYLGPWSGDAQACLEALQPSRVTLGGRIPLAELFSWTWLHHLALKYVNNAGLAHLSGLSALQTLDLRHTQVSDAGLAHLSRLTALQTLGLMETQVSDAGLAHLSRLSALQNLGLMETQVSDAGLAHLSRLSALQNLDLSFTRVTMRGSPIFPV